MLLYGLRTIWGMCFGKYIFQNKKREKYPIFLENYAITSLLLTSGFYRYVQLVFHHHNILPGT